MTLAEKRDEVLRLHNNGMTVKEISEAVGITPRRVREVIFRNQRNERAIELRCTGMQITEIGELLDVSPGYLCLIFNEDRNRPRIEAAMQRNRDRARRSVIKKIIKHRREGKSFAWIAKQMDCSPQTARNYLKDRPDYHEFLERGAGLEDRVREARKIRDSGASWSETAKRVGRSKTYVRWAYDHPRFKD